MAALVYPPSQNAVQKTLGAQLLTGVTAAATLNNVTGLQNKAGVFVVDRVDTNGVETPAKREYISYAGTSGSTLVTLVRNVDGSGTDQDHAIGAIVEFIPDVVWAQAINDVITAEHTTGGVHTGLVKTASPVFTVGSDASGDTYYHNAGASLSRLGLGTVDQILSANASQPIWVSKENTGWVTASGATLAGLDFKLGTKFTATIVPSAGPFTFAPSNASVSQVAMLRVNYASTVSQTLNLFTLNATISWYGSASLPVPTSTLNKPDLFGFACISSLPEFDGVIIGQARY